MTSTESLDNEQFHIEFGLGDPGSLLPTSFSPVHDKSDNSVLESKWPQPSDRSPTVSEGDRMAIRSAMLARHASLFRTQPWLSRMIFDEDTSIDELLLVSLFRAAHSNGFPSEEDESIWLRPPNPPSFHDLINQALFLCNNASHDTETPGEEEDDAGVHGGFATQLQIQLEGGFDWDSLLGVGAASLSIVCFILLAIRVDSAMNLSLRSHKGDNSDPAVSIPGLALSAIGLGNVSGGAVLARLNGLTTAAITLWALRAELMSSTTFDKGLAIPSEQSDDTASSDPPHVPQSLSDVSRRLDLKRPYVLRKVLTTLVLCAIAMSTPHLLYGRNLGPSAIFIIVMLGFTPYPTVFVLEVCGVEDSFVVRRRNYLTLWFYGIAPIVIIAWFMSTCHLVGTGARLDPLLNGLALLLLSVLFAPG